MWSIIKIGLYFCLAWCVKIATLWVAITNFHPPGDGNGLLYAAIGFTIVILIYVRMAIIAWRLVSRVWRSV